MSQLDHSESIRTLVVTSRRTIADGIIELELGPQGDMRLPAWTPGAHIDLRLGEDLIRQYSLMRGAENRWRIAVLVEPEGRGGSLRIAEELHVGATVKSSGPRNHFELVPGQSYLFVAGGIGITPIIEMAREARRAGSPFVIAYLGRSRTHMAYVDDVLDEFGESVSIFAADEGRRLEVMSAVAEAGARAEVYCCGPERLMEAMEASVDDLARIHVERFHPREIVTDEPDREFTVYAATSDVEFVVPADETILMAADFEGIIVPGDCLEGTCGSCETRVLSGAVDHRDSVLSPLQRVEGDTMMICVSRSRSDRLELEL